MSKYLDDLGAKQKLRSAHLQSIKDVMVPKIEFGSPLSNFLTSWDSDLEEGDVSEWEDQEIRKCIQDLDRDLREVILQASVALWDLHNHEVPRINPSASGGISSHANAIPVRSAILSARIDGVFHREAMSNE